MRRATLATLLAIFCFLPIAAPAAEAPAQGTPTPAREKVKEKVLYRWGEVPMQVNAAAAEAVVVGRVVGVKPARRVDVNLHPDFVDPAEDKDWRPIQVEVAEFLLEPAANPPANPANPANPTNPANPAARPAAPRPPGLPGPRVLDVLVAPSVPVDPAADAKPVKPDPGIAPVELNRATRYIFFLDRIAGVDGYVLLANTACYLADDKSVAAAKAALRFDTWDWGPPAGSLRACYIVEPKADLEVKPGQTAGICWIQGWVVLHNTAAAPVKVTIGSPAGFLRTGVPATVEATSAGGTRFEVPVHRSSRVVVPPGRCAFSDPPQNALHHGMIADFKQMTAGEWTVRARLPLTQVDGQPPAAGQDVLWTPPVKVKVAVRPPPPPSLPDDVLAIGPGAPEPPPAGKVVFVCLLRDPASLPTVRRELTTALAAFTEDRSFNLLFVGDAGKPTALSDKGPVAGTDANRRRAADFLAKAAATKATDPLPALRSAFDQAPDLIFFLTDSSLPDPSLPAAVAKLNRRKTKVNTILFGTAAGDTTHAMLERVAKDNGGNYRIVTEDDLKQ